VRVELRTDEPVAEAKARTGKTLEEWFAVLDGRGGTAAGRKAHNDFLYLESKVPVWWVSLIVNEYERARGQTEKDGRLKGYNICCTKTIAAPVEAVYAAWSSQAALRQWLGDRVTAEVADGGALDDGDGNRGTFKRVRPNKDLRFTWVGATGDECLVDMTVADKGKGKTGILVNVDRIQTREEADGLRAAWLEALDRLKSRLEGGQ
jgi:uncharacterized protein YndB with AHSA1/START domain